MKRVWKRMCAMVCAASMLLMLLPTIPFTVAANESGDFTYTVLADGTAEITGYTGSEKEVVVPSVLDGYTVTSIGMYAFFSLEESLIESITLPDTVITIEDYAFYDCKSLVTVTLPNALKTIGEFAFANCESLVTITLPELITSMEEGVFSHCTALESVTLNNGLTIIGPNAFEFCSALTTVTFPDTVTDIGAYAFSYCHALTEVTFSKKLNTIGDAAFLDCNKLTTLGIPDGAQTIGMQAFAYCTSLKSVTLPATLTILDPVAFAYCSSLKSIVIPETVEDVGSGAFRECTALQSVTLPKTLVSVGNGAFDGCSSLEAVYYAGTEEEKKAIVFYEDNQPLLYARWCYDAIGGTQSGDYLYSILADGTAEIVGYVGKEKDLIVPAVLDGYAVTSIGIYAFYENTSLERIVFPEGIRSIDHDAFNGCESLKSVVFPDGMQSIGRSAFSTCTALETLVLPVGLTSIESYAFGYCDALEYIVIPDTIESIEKDSFYCNAATDVYYAGDKKQWVALRVEEDAFFNSVRMHFGTETPHWGELTVSLESTCIEHGVGWYSCSCGHTEVVSLPFSDHTYHKSGYVAPTCTTDGYTEFVCDCCKQSIRGVYKKGGHTFYNNVCAGCGLAVGACLATSHAYSNDEDASWTLYQPGAGRITLTFSSETEMDEGFDFLYVYDGADTLIAVFTGTEAAGQTIDVASDVVKLRFTSDTEMVYYGFAVTDVTTWYLDADGDSVLDSSDARRLLFGVIGLIGNMIEEEVALADQNDDGVVNTSDVRCLLQTMVTA